MGTGAGEAVQPSSDAAKDDGLPRLEGEGVGLLTTTVQRVRRVIDKKIKSEVPSPQTLSLYTWCYTVLTNGLPRHYWLLSTREQ